MATPHLLRLSTRVPCLGRANTAIRPIIRSHTRGVGRNFATTSSWQLQTSEMSQDDLKSLRVNQERLMSTLHDTCQWGTGTKWGDGPTDTGMSRLSLSDADKQVRDWFKETTEELGCKVTIDTMGNMFAVRPGKNNDAPPTFAGSHLDTQPAGGRYDGILGVTAGVEMLKVLNENWVETEYPVGVVNWTNEEGARFVSSAVASAVWADDIPLDEAHALEEVGSGTATMKSELERIGYLGSVETSHKATPMAAHFELHIEQGPVLEAEGQKIGVVKGVQARSWLTVEVKGRDAHTGATPLEIRADALLTASKMIVVSHKIATENKCYISTGLLNVSPGSINSVPGHVRFSLDVRAYDFEEVEKISEKVRKVFQEIAQGTGNGGIDFGGTPGLPCEVKITQDSWSKSVDFHDDCTRVIRESAQAALGDNADPLIREMRSGAVHDSVYTSHRCPTAMIFVPSKDGISHNPVEYTKPEECALGATTLLGAVLRYDKLRWEKENKL